MAEEECMVIHNPGSWRDPNYVGQFRHPVTVEWEEAFADHFVVWCFHFGALIPCTLANIATSSTYTQDSKNGFVAMVVCELWDWSSESEVDRDDSVGRSPDTGGDSYAVVAWTRRLRYPGTRYDVRQPGYGISIPASHHMGLYMF